jgi:hypothetical protein
MNLPDHPDSAEKRAHREPLAQWQRRTPNGSVSIALDAGGTWKVVYEGFSRSSNRSLMIALAEATGARHHELWLQDLAAALEDWGRRGICAQEFA